MPCAPHTKPHLNPPVFTDACFLSHFKAEAGSDARYFADLLMRMLGGAPVFIGMCPAPRTRMLRATTLCKGACCTAAARSISSAAARLIAAFVEQIRPT
jgi:hypothetical protein